MSESLNPVSDETLTEKEKFILQLLADGNTVRAAASQVGLTEMTVHQYTLKIRMKLESPNIANAVACGIRRNIID